MTLFFRLKRFSTALVFLGLLTAGLLPSTGIPEPGGDPLGRLLQDIGNDRTDYTAYQRLLLSLRRGIDRRTAASDRNIERAAGFFDKLLEESPDDPLRHYARGMTAKLAGDYPAAVGHFEAGIAAGARFWDIFSEVVPYYRTKQEMLDAIDLLQRRLEVDPENAFLHQGLGGLHFWMDDYEPAEEHLQRALELHSRAGDIGSLPRCLFNLSHLQMYQNKYDAARASIERSIRIARESGHGACEIRSMELFSFIMIDMGDYRGALELCRRAYDRALEKNDPDLIYLCLRTLGVARMETGDLAGAEDNLKHAAAWYRRLGEERRLGVVNYWQSLLYKQLGDFSRALDIAQHGLKIARRLGFRTAEAFHLSSIGDFYQSLGHYDKALAYNKKALMISENYIGKWSRESCFNAIGTVYMETQRYREALEYFKLALNYIRQISHIREEASCLYNIGLVYFEMGDDAQALDYFLRCRGQAELSGKRAVLGSALNRLGDLALRRGDGDTADGLFRAALAIGRDTGQPGIRWQGYAGLGALAAGRNRILEAAEFYKRAAAVIEDQRSQIMERQHSAGFFQNKLGVYENLVNLYYGLHVINPGRGYDRECFLYAEKAKSRAFLDDLQSARIDAMTFSGSPETRRKIRTLSRSVSALLTELGGANLDRTSREGLWERMERAEEELQLVVETARRERPDLAVVMRGEPSSLDRIRSAALTPGTALIEYLVGERNLFIFFLTADRLAVHRLDAGETRVTRELAADYTRLLASPRMSREDCAAAGRRLYEFLILPGKEVLTRDIRRLIVVPDRELCYLPFETLTPETGGGSRRSSPNDLLHTHAVTYAPSASSLVILTRKRDRPRRKDLLAVGDPQYRAAPAPSDGRDWDNPLQEYYLEKRFEVGPLPYSRKEIRAVSRFFRGGSRDIILGGEASEEAIKSLPLADYRILHFATHTLMDERAANRSALVLTQDADPTEDGFLQVQEIYDSRLDADLVVLSACRSALGKLDKGEGVQGLPRAFFCAGASSVVVSLWPVADRSTARFMEKFYRHLSEGESKEEALRRAKQDMRKSDGRPYSWAGFILMGEGSRTIPMNRPSLLQRIMSRIF